MRSLFLLIVALQCQFLFPQKTIENRTNWFAYIGQYKFTSRWGVHVEGQFRMDGDVRFSNQNLFRVGAIYYPSNNSNIAVGVGLINTLNASLGDYFNEERIWEQYQYTHKWAETKNMMLTRIRLEQRFVDQIGLVDNEVVRIKTNYQNRFRLMTRHLFHLKDVNEHKDELYLVFQDEVFLNVGDNEVNPHFFDQNRFLAGIGLQTGSNFRMELGYMNQLINPGKGADLMNHTISISLLHNLNLWK